ncbi:MAG: YfhO family protein [Erysipelotrichaceae bacterium]|nr:YfhO family protein [Erysipelotrichaceae bacterium]
MTKNKYKYPILLFLILSFITLFIFVPYLITDTEFVLGWDMRTLYSSNFEALRNLLKSCIQNHELPFWSWYSFLGNDYYSSKLFYFQDIFDYPFALTNLSYYTVIKIQTYLKFIIAGFCFYSYARYNKYSYKTSIIGSIMFAFSAYGLQTMMHPFFASFFIFIPLYFKEIDRYIYENKSIRFILVVFFLFINNYYLFYSVTIFTVLYFIYRYYSYHSTIKGFFKNAIVLVGYYLIGMCMSAIVLVPEALSILSNSRIGNKSSTFIYDSIIPYIDYLTGIFMPTSVLSNRNTAITPIYSYVSANDSVMAVFLWASSCLSLLFFQFFNNKKDKIKNIVAFTIITLLALVPFLSSFMHGFSEPSFRWLQSPTFLLITCTLPFIENLDTINNKKLTVGLIITLITLLFSPIILSIISGYKFFDMLDDYKLILVFIPFVVLTYFCLKYRKQTALMIVIICELCLTSYLSFYACPYFSGFNKELIKQVHNVLGNENDYNNYLLAIDNNNVQQFYRTYVDPTSVYWDFSLNLNYDFNIMGLISYDSTYNSSANDMKLIDPNIESYLPWVFDIRNKDIMNLVSVKYAIVTEESQVPFTNYHYVSDYNYFKIYENDDYVNLGKTYDSVISYEQYQNDTSIINNTIICHEEDMDAISNYISDTKSEFTNVVYTNNTLYAEIDCNKRSFGVISVPFNKGWTITINNKKVTPYSVNGGLIGIPLDEGYNCIYLSFVPYGFKQGAILSLIGTIILIITIVIKRIVKH